MTDSRPSTDAADRAELDQTAMVSRLPRTEIVDRIAHLTERARGRRVIHVGFADVSFHDDQLATESWLHHHLAEVADSLVGIDLDAGRGREGPGAGLRGVRRGLHRRRAAGGAAARAGGSGHRR